MRFVISAVLAAGAIAAVFSGCASNPHLTDISGKGFVYEKD